MRLFWTLLIVLLTTAPARAEENAYQRVLRTGVLRCGYMAWPPYFIYDPNTKKLSGFFYDMTNGMAKLMNLKVDYVAIQVGQQVEELKTNHIDAVCGDAPWVLDTVKYLDYTNPFYYQASYIYGRADETRIKTLADLNNPAITFLGMDGDLSSDLAPRRFPQAKLRTLSVNADQAQMFTEVVTKKADAVLLDAASGHAYMKANPGKIKLLLEKPIAVQGGGFSVKKGESELFNMLNGAVNAALNNGFIDDVMRGYDPDNKQYLRVALPYR